MSDSTMSEDLSGKVAIITGANSGIGLAIAIMFAQRGAKITLCGRDHARLQEALGECTRASGGHHERFITVAGDLVDAKVREDTVRKTIRKFSVLDILVTNAGVSSCYDNPQHATEETYHHIFDTNVKSVFFLIQAATIHLEKSKGTVISVSSGLSTMPADIILYAMSKAALDHMTRCLALDLGPKGIRVNSVNPSFIASRIFRDCPGNADDLIQKIAAKEKSMQPMGECGTADDVAQSVSFLASDAAKFVTGHCLYVDGGRCLAGPKVSK